ncbi:MAG TPA: hypothetical protein VGS41_14150, partial [Chthonomonadales bacterium]|nr:hypothetical protein [Chthonomonadales bacterium]
MRWMAAFLKWLHPGMRVKRWVVLAFAGLLLFLLGLTVMAQTRRTGQGASVRLARAIIAATHAGVRPGIMGVIVTCFGALVFLFAIGRLIHSLTSALGEVGKGGL